MRRREGEEGEKEVTSTWTTACLCLLKAHKSPPSRASFWCCRPPSCRTAPASGFLLPGRQAKSAVHRVSAGPEAGRETRCTGPNCQSLNHCCVFQSQNHFKAKDIFKGGIHSLFGVRIVSVSIQRDSQLGGRWVLLRQHGWHHKAPPPCSPFAHLPLKHTPHITYRLPATTHGWVSSSSCQSHIQTWQWWSDASLITNDFFNLVKNVSNEDKCSKHTIYKLTISTLSLITLITHLLLQKIPWSTFLSHSSSSPDVTFWHQIKNSRRKKLEFRPTPFQVCKTYFQELFVGQNIFQMTFSISIKEIYSIHGWNTKKIWKYIIYLKLTKKTRRKIYKLNSCFCNRSKNIIDLKTKNRVLVIVWLSSVLPAYSRAGESRYSLLNYLELHNSACWATLCLVSIWGEHSEVWCVLHPCSEKEQRAPVIPENIRQQKESMH